MKRNKLFQKIYMYFEEKRNWREKMDTPCVPIPMTIEEYAAMKERDMRKCNADSGEQTISE